MVEREEISHSRPCYHFTSSRETLRRRPVLSAPRRVFSLRRVFIVFLAFSL
jgi:hypothetical protein